MANGEQYRALVTTTTTTTGALVAVVAEHSAQNGQRKQNSSQSRDAKLERSSCWGQIPAAFQLNSISGKPQLLVAAGCYLRFDIHLILRACPRLTPLNQSSLWANNNRGRVAHSRPTTG